MLDFQEVDLTWSVTATVNAPWYAEDIGPRLKPAIKEAYLKWAGLSGDALIARLYDIRGRAWAYAPYPCVGQWMFALPSISAFPQYLSILNRALGGAKILDMACCFGQDLRLLASHGVPTENMYASDLVGELWELGYELFSDKDKMKAHFIQANVFDENSLLYEFNGKMDIVIANQFIHLFDWEKQVIATKVIAGFTNGPGAVVVGYQRAREETKNEAMPWGEMFVHNIQSWQELWRQVGKETGTKWNVDATLVDLKEWGMEKEDFAWMDQYPLGINFVVTRLE